MARKVQRTDWNPLIKNINKLASRDINSDFYLKKGYETGGFNRAFLSKNYDLFIERVEVKKGRDYNKYLDEYEFKKKYGKKIGIKNGKDIYEVDKELLADYRKQRKEFLEYLGYKTNAISGTQKEVELMQQRIDETRELEVGQREIKSKSDGKKHTYGETREWGAEEWQAFNDFNKHMTSDEAMELTFAIFNDETDTIDFYQRKGEVTVNNLIKDYILLEYIRNDDVGDVLKI